MLVPALAVGLLVALWLTSKPTHSISTSGAFLGQLRKGATFRLFAHVAPGAKRGDIDTAVTLMGFGTPMLVSRDPSNPAIATILAVWNGKGTALEMQSWPLNIFQVDEVDDPPPVERPRKTVTLDRGLTAGEVSAVIHAIQNDSDPKHLTGFASTLEPDYPIAAAILRGKAKLVAVRGAASETTQKALATEAAVRKRFQAEAQQKGWDSAKVWQAMLVDTIGVMKRVTVDLGPKVEAAWEKLRRTDRPLMTLSPQLLWAATEWAKTNKAAPSYSDLVAMSAISVDTKALAADPMAPHEVRTLITKLVADPTLLRKSIQDLVNEFGCKPIVAAAALACVREHGDGVATVNKGTYEMLLPEPPPVASASALALAATTIRPTLSVVIDPVSAARRAADMVSRAKDGDKDAKLGKRQLERATKTLERQKWVQWYKKLRDQGLADAVTSGKLTGREHA